MRTLIPISILTLVMASTAFSASSVYDFTVDNIDGRATPLSQYKGKVVMVVNVASKCGYTPQYDALEKLYEKYKDQGFVILGFPANNFGGQEPGTNEEIKTFCSRRDVPVKFPLFAKMSVKGEDKSPLYQYLTDKTSNGEFGGEIGWNFTKFLVGKDGKVVNRFATPVKPDDPKVIDSLEKALASK